MIDKNTIERYNPAERANHWVVAVSFILLAVGGLALFYPPFYNLTYLFGNGTWTRILHPFIGVLMAVSFARLASRFWHLNHIGDNDRAWMKRIFDVIFKRGNNLPEVGHYNAGQKYLFWTMVGAVAILTATGVVMWQPWFAPIFPVGLVRIASLLHALASFVLLAGIIVHVYAAIWVKGTLSAMTNGTVTRAWARTNHPGWYREVSKGSK
jgi:formate dehydrogenase subunit gamma